MNAHMNAARVQDDLKNSLERLSTGLRINKAADDVSGISIADTLRSQASALGQAINNTNDAVGIIQIADKAMDEQLKLLDTIKVRATQAASDGQSTESRKAIQSDIVRLIQALDSIGNNTSYNGQSLLTGVFSNKEFQVGAYSNQSVKASIGATTSDKIGQVRLNTGAVITASSQVSLTFKNVDGDRDVRLESVKISTSAGTGLGALAEIINKSSDKTGIKATATVVSTSDKEIMSGAIDNLNINGVQIGNVRGIKRGDSDGRLVQAINSASSDTGVEAYTDTNGRLNLRSIDGRGIVVKAEALKDQSSGSADGAQEQPQEVMAIESLNGGQKLTEGGSSNFGRLTLSRLDVRDIVVLSSSDSQNQGYSSIGFGVGKTVTSTVNLRSVLGNFDASVKSAVGANSNSIIASGNSSLGAGVTTLKGAMLVMDVAESAQKILDKIRADLGSAQSQMMSTLNSISVAQVNVKASESQIRDVDFAQESANFSKNSILAQSGSYAMSQANAIQQNILRLLT